MNKSTVPPAISEYINNKFRDNFLTDIKTIESKDGHLHYHVDVTHDNLLHHLMFNSDGTLIAKDLEPINELNDGDDDINED